MSMAASRAATTFDLLDYLDDLPLESSQHSVNEDHEQQQVSESGHSRRADEETLEDSSDYIDVTIAWTTRPSDRPLSSDNKKEAHPESSDREQQHESSQTTDSSDNDGNPDAGTEPHEQRHHPQEDAQEDLRWRVDLSKLLLSTNGTLEKFHMSKWRETLQLVRGAGPACV